MDGGYQSIGRPPLLLPLPASNLAKNLIDYGILPVVFDSVTVRLPFTMTEGKLGGGAKDERWFFFFFVPFLSLEMTTARIRIQRDGVAKSSFETPTFLISTHCT